MLAIIIRRNSIWFWFKNIFYTNVVNGILLSWYLINIILLVLKYKEVTEIFFESISYFVFHQCTKKNFQYLEISYINFWLCLFSAILRYNKTADLFSNIGISGRQSLFEISFNNNLLKSLLPFFIFTVSKLFYCA